MIRNFFLIAYRHLRQHRLYSFINIGGLSIGIGACMLILLFVIHEHSYDQFHTNASRIYSVYARIKIGGDTIQFGGMSYGTAPTLEKADPAVEATLRMENSRQKKAVCNPLRPDSRFGENNFLFADAGFFNFFSFRLKRGDPARVLARPFTVVITEEMARKYFGDSDPIGKTLQYDSAFTFEVTGVADRAPSNSSIDYGFVAALSSKAIMSKTPTPSENDVLFGNYTTYLRLRPDARPVDTEHRLLALSRRDPSNADIPARYCLTALAKTHLTNNFSDDGSSRYLSVFPLVAGLILLLALINYMNLSTARATLRAKEVGIRKTVGASRAHIAQQFYIESALYALIAFTLGLILFRIAQPYFYRLIHLSIDTSFIYQPKVILLFTALLVVTIFIAGTYPSIVLSSYNPVAVLYGKLSRQKGGTGLRKLLTIIQFTASIVLIISSILIERQLYYFRHADTGVNRDNVLTVPFARTMGEHYHSFAHEVEGLRGISGAATARYSLYLGYDMSQVYREGLGKDLSINSLKVDDQFIPLLGIQWKYPPATHDIYSQDHQIIVNEAAIGKLHLPINPVGSRLRIGSEDYSIAGVVKNFNYNSLHSKIDALSLMISKDTVTGSADLQNGCLMVKIGKGVDLPTMIGKIKQIYTKYDISTPFEYQFLDEAFDSRYKAEDKLAGILDVFTGLTVFIACLGLFGLAAFSASQKTKEIGIRKVLGASVRNIMFLLTKDFMRLVLAAIILATPVAWYLMNEWLMNFAYKISIGWTVFVIAGGAAMLIALLTVCVEAFRAAIANPVNSLK